VIDLVSKAKTLVQERDKLENGRMTKRRQLTVVILLTASDVMGSDGCNGIDGKNGDEAMSRLEPPQLAPGYNIWWDSEKAQKLFSVSKETETAID
jgi:hypothetical protein